MHALHANVANPRRAVRWRPVTGFVPTILHPLEYMTMHVMEAGRVPTLRADFKGKR